MRMESSPLWLAFLILLGGVKAFYNVALIPGCICILSPGEACYLHIGKHLYTQALPEGIGIGVATFGGALSPSPAPALYSVEYKLCMSENFGMLWCVPLGSKHGVISTC